MKAADAPSPDVPAASVPRPEASPLALVPWLVRATAAGADPSATLDVVPTEQVDRPDDGSTWLAGAGTHFGASAVWTPLERPDSGWSVVLSISLAQSETPLDASIEVAVRVPADRDPDWLVPGAFIGANRPADSRSPYPRWVPDDDPALGRDPFAASSWAFRADRAATPAAFATGGRLRVAIATAETGPLGMAGLGFATTTAVDGTRWRELRLHHPYREEPVVYDGSAAPLPPDRPSHRWAPGEPVVLAFLVYAVPADGDATATILRSLWRRLAPSAPSVPRLGAAATAALAAEGLLRWHHRPREGVLIETAAFRRRGDGSGLEPGDRLAMHVGWLSGAPAAQALLAHGRRTGHREAVAAGRQVLDAVTTHLAPCGTFWGQWTAEHGWRKGWTPGPDALHARTLGEAALFVARAAATEPDAMRWREAIESNARFVLAAQRADGRIPSAWNGTTGEPSSWAGTAGLAWVPALVAAAGLLGEPDLRAAAVRAGDAYADEVSTGSLSGAPEDVDLGPTSEDGYVAIMAAVALATAADRRSERRRWVELARRAADWTLAFRYAYDVAFRPESLLGRIGFRTRGADLASPANQHLHAYGLICSTELVELSRLTGDPHYAERARETFTCFRQGIATRDGDLGGARRGMAPERFFQTRYDGDKGDVGPLSHAWCLGLLLHAAEAACTKPELADG